MLRSLLVTLACLATLPASAETTVKVPGTGTEKAVVVAPTPAKAETGLQKILSDADAKSKAWDSKLRRTMATVCKGC